MSMHIDQQNNDILESWKLPGHEVSTNTELCDVLGISVPSGAYVQDYKKDDIKVKII